MSNLKGKVGPVEIEWKKIPHGQTGSASFVFTDAPGKPVSVNWRMDGFGLILETPDGVFSYDLRERLLDDGGSEFEIHSRGSGFSRRGLQFIREGDAALSAAGGGTKKALKIKSQMPGKILKVLVKAGDSVQKDQPLLVMEAMKMENEIRAPQAGEIAEVKVAEGQTVETGAALILFG
jgi:hypothetical protein